MKHHKKGLLTIIDLAGSERQTEGDQLIEARFINKSIAALGTTTPNIQC